MRRSALLLFTACTLPTDPGSVDTDVPSTCGETFNDMVSADFTADDAVPVDTDPADTDPADTDDAVRFTLPWTVDPESVLLWVEDGDTCYTGVWLGRVTPARSLADLCIDQGGYVCIGFDVDVPAKAIVFPTGFRPGSQAIVHVWYRSPST